MTRASPRERRDQTQSAYLRSVGEKADVRGRRPGRRERANSGHLAARQVAAETINVVTRLGRGPQAGWHNQSPAWLAARSSAARRRCELRARQVWQEREGILAADCAEFGRRQAKLLHATRRFFQRHKRIVAAEQNLTNRERASSALQWPGDRPCRRCRNRAARVRNRCRLALSQRCSWAHSRAGDPSPSAHLHPRVRK